MDNKQPFVEPEITSYERDEISQVYAFTAPYPG